MEEKKERFCEWIEAETGRAVMCPFFILDLGTGHYCGYYGKDIGNDKKRLGGCDIEAVVKRSEELSRRVEKKPLPGEG